MLNLPLKIKNPNHMVRTHKQKKVKANDFYLYIFKERV